jgi:hypothetical protein
VTSLFAENYHRLLAAASHTTLTSNADEQELRCASFADSPGPQQHNVICTLVSLFRTSHRAPLARLFRPLAIHILTLPSSRSHVSASCDLITLKSHDKASHDQAKHKPSDQNMHSSKKEISFLNASMRRILTPLVRRPSCEALLLPPTPPDPLFLRPAHLDLRRWRKHAESQTTA